MTVTIDLPAEVERDVRQQAAKNGQDVGAFILQAVKERIAKTRSFDEVCAAFAHAVATSGVDDQEFDRFFEEVRQDVWQEKQGKHP